MRILFQNRADAYDAWGGDTTQMEETRHALTALNVKVDVSLEQKPPVRGYDLVHVFNIQRADYSVAQVLNAKRQGIPVALSTIYWDMRHLLASNEYFRYEPNPEIRLLGHIHPALPRHYINLRTFPRRRRIARCARRMLMEADILLPNSHAELEILALVFALPQVRGKAVVVPNAVRPHTANIAPDDFTRDLPHEYVLEVAFYYPVKGQRRLILSLMEHPEIPLVLVGGGLDSLYGRECQRLGQQRGNTYCLGFIPHERLVDLYRKSKVHILPSLRESPGLSTLEAAAYGANCVVSVHGPVTEYFGDDAWVCDPEDSMSIRYAVLSAWAAPRQTRLQQRVLREFTWENAARATLLGYERALRGLNSNPPSLDEPDSPCPQ